MIQRIQSIYLLVAAMLTMAMYFSPIAVFNNSDQVYEMFTCHIHSIGNVDKLVNLLPLSILPALSTLISILAIFSFKNRLLQLKLGKLNYVVLVSLIIVAIIYFMKLGNLLNVDGKPAFIAVFPLISFIFVFMANRAIKKDEDLIKSADRIR